MVVVVVVVVVVVFAAAAAAAAAAASFLPVRRSLVLRSGVRVSEVFREMERIKEELDIAYYVVGQESMEQVFLSFARKSELISKAEDEAFLARRQRSQAATGRGSQAARPQQEVAAEQEQHHEEHNEGSNEDAKVRQEK